MTPPAKWLSVASDGAALLCWVSLMRAYRRLSVPLHDMYKAGYNRGEQHGYEEGRRIGRPVVLPLDLRIRRTTADDGSASKL